MDKTKQLIGERITERTLKITGPERLLEEFVQRIVIVSDIMLASRDRGEMPKDVGVAILIFGYLARPLLTLLPPIGTLYTLGLQEEE